jgi:outer membrane immunogenic protein
MNKFLNPAFSILGLTFGLTLGLAAPASAADLPVKAPPLVPVAIYDWTGFYIGVNGGGGFSGNRTTIVNETFAGAPFIAGTWPGTGNFGSRTVSGGFGGGEIGYNWQRGHFVFGLEADIEGSGISGSSLGTITPYIAAPNSITAGVNERLNWFGTARGRVGWAWDRFMLYATGGFAYGEVKSTLTMTDTFGFAANATDSSTRTGYVVGAGGEYAFNNSWSIKAEYQYIDLGRRTLNAVEFTGGAPSAFAVNNTSRYDYHTVRVGVNYKWGAPVVAKY